MVVCYFCCKHETESYWSYYCSSCIKIKSFCKLVSPERLVDSFQFQLNANQIDLLNQDIETKLDKLDMKVKRRSKRINKNKYDTNESMHLDLKDSTELYDNKSE